MFFPVFFLQEDFPVAEANEQSFKLITEQSKSRLVDSRTYCLKDYSAHSLIRAEKILADSVLSVNWRIVVGSEARNAFMTSVGARPPVSFNLPFFYVDNQNYTGQIESSNLFNPEAEQTRLISVLKDIFRNEGVPGNLVWLAEVESSLNPEAESKAGAAGLFQIMPATAERFGLNVFPIDDRKSPAKSAQAAACYLRQLRNEFGCWALALAAYNAGEGRVGRAMKSNNARTFNEVAPYLPSETRRYVPRVMAVMALREDQMRGVPSALFRP